MFQNIYEFSVGPVKEKSQKVMMLIAKIVKIIFIVVSVIFIMFTLFIDYNFWIFLVLFAIPVVPLQLIQWKLYNFYDYIFVDGSIRIVKVRNNNTRKAFLIFDCKDIESIGLYCGTTYNNYCKNKDYKKLNATPNYLIDGDITIRVAVNGKKYLLSLEYDEEFLARIIKVVGNRLLDKDLIDRIIALDEEKKAKSVENEQ